MLSCHGKAALSGSLTAASLKPMGTDAPAGLQAGINAGRSGRIPAMESAARAAVEAVEFHDPYRVAPAGTSPMGGNGTLK